MKTDKSTRVGGRRKKGGLAPKGSVASMVRGKPCLVTPAARKTYTNDGKPSNGRPCKNKPTRRIR